MKNTVDEAGVSQIRKACSRKRVVSSPAYQVVVIAVMMIQQRRDKPAPLQFRFLQRRVRTTGFACVCFARTRLALFLVCLFRTRA